MEKNDIIDLGDSIIRGYPISSLLLMPENGTLKVPSHDLINNESFLFQKNTSILDNEAETKLYILDGQQRMTSIAKLFLACDSKYQYYYDLLAILVDKFPNDRIENDPAFTKPSRSPDALCHAYEIKKDKSEQPTRGSYRYISGEKIVFNQFGSIISKFLKTLKNAADEDIDKYTDYLNAILGSISSYNVSATEISGDSELGIVIRVFEKVNSTGKKLTLFDLINAKSYHIKNNGYSDGLAVFFTKRIDSVTHTDPSLKNSAHKYFKYSQQESYEELARIIRILEITHLLNHSQTPSMSKPIMLNREPEFWFNGWIKHENMLFKTIQWLHEQQLLDTAPLPFFEYIIAIFLACPNTLDNPIFTSMVKKYALYLTLTGSAFNKSNLDIVEEFYRFALHLKNSHEIQQQNVDSLRGKPNLTANKVLGYTTAKSEFKAVFNILYQEKPEGKFCQDILGNQININNPYISHHIYPKKLVHEFTNKSPFNSIANIICVHPLANSNIIRDKSPHIYFAKLGNQLGRNKLDQYCAQNLICFDDVYNMDNQNKADKFIKNRAEKIAEIVNNYFEI